MDIKVFYNQQKVADALAVNIASSLNNMKKCVILPSGSDANIFYSSLAGCINHNKINVSEVIFIQGEELVPLATGHPISFGIKIKELFSEPLRDNINIMYLSSEIDDPVMIVNQFKTKFDNISPNITILGINTDGDFLGVTPDYFEKSDKINLIDLTDNKWKKYLELNNFFEKYHDIHKPYLLSLGKNLFKTSDDLYIIASGEHKKNVIADIVSKKYNTSIGRLVKFREEQGLKTFLYIDSRALGNEIL